ncbi:translocon-associated protein subunit beta-like [Papaver somniferum]|uniref:translocon-associated protein subunit beta-like n=1 Tax=Papaver somniferum TaxID=3469 RepID=UPI000E6F509C|nr:translocon-associated protein subunit beta-like [Papaver somniferum]
MANLKISTLCLFFLLSASSLGSCLGDGVFIVAHKKVSLNKLRSGMERVSVTIDIYNRGSETAYDVSLTDDSWPHHIFDIAKGNFSKSWESLDAGSAVSHSFDLVSQVKGIFNGESAIIKFRVPTKAALQVAYSNPMLTLDVLADRPAEKKIDLAKRLLTKYGSLVTVISVVVTFVYLVATPSKSGSAKSGKKRR